MFNAQDAQRIVHDYYEANEPKCQDWVVKHLEDALSKVHDYATKGHTELYYEVCIEKEKYRVIKKKLLLYGLMKQGFKVCVSEHNKRDGVVKTYTVYTISWATNK